MLVGQHKSKHYNILRYEDLNLDLYIMIIKNSYDTGSDDRDSTVLFILFI